MTRKYVEVCPPETDTFSSGALVGSDDWHVWCSLRYETLRAALKNMETM